MTLTWYDGGLMPTLMSDVPFPKGDGGGGIFVGERGYLTYQTYGENPLVYPEPWRAWLRRCRSRIRGSRCRTR